MIFNERFSVNSQKQIKKLEENMLVSFFGLIESLKKNPLPLEAVRCKDVGFENIFKIFLSKYALLYEILFEEGIILIYSIKKEY